MKYRREIDGLRALAVLPVILFHAGFEAFSGGFVGVDVFFVISGYLITTIILAELEQDKFSIVNFYERRARRILPALFFVMFVCLPFAWFWLLPSAMKDFSQSLVAVSVFASNILFWRESGYFAAAAELKPLLHTWSLAVEEQYYLVFPLFLILTWRFGKRSILFLLAGVFVASFATVQWASIASPSAAFYLLPTRGWELLVGAFAAFYLSKNNRTKLSRSVGEAGGGVGLALILYAVFAYSKTTPFPGVYALAPTVGTVLIILFATQQTTIGRFIGNKAFVGIGLISYSAYLWHQPLFAFARVRSLTEPSEIVFGMLSIGALVPAYFSWRYVEAPFRSHVLVSRVKLFAFSILGTLFFIGIGAIGVFNDGFKNRFDIPNTVYDSIKRTSRSSDCFDKTDVHKIKDWYCTIGAENATKNLMVFGDSHALSVLPAIDDVTKKLGISGVFVGASGCTPFLGIHALRNDQSVRNCNELNTRVFNYVKDNKIPLVVLVARWSYYTDGGYEGNNFSFINTKPDGNQSKQESRKAFDEGLEKTVDAYRNIGVKLILVSQVSQQKVDPLQIFALSSLYKDRDIKEFSVKRDEHFALQSFVRQSFKRVGVEVLDLDNVFCDTTWCAVGDKSSSYYIDQDHLSLEGSKKLEKSLLSILGSP